MNIDDDAERATTFDAEKAPPGNRLDESESHYEHYKRLSLANSSSFNGEWRDEKRQTAKNSSALLDAIASQLELTDYQKSESHREYKNLPDRFKNSRYPPALLVLCVCGLVANRDGRDYHPNEHHPQVSERSLFSDIVDDIGTSHSILCACWNAVRREVNQ